VVTILLAALAGGVVGVATFLVFEWATPATIELAPVTPGSIVVQIDGAVATPGLVTLPVGSRLADGIDAAGGLAANADVTRLNMAARLGDGDQVNIPTLQPTSASGSPEAVSDSDGLVNINTATVDQLVQLPGIGPVIAQRIIDFREFYGPFTSIDQLDEVSGISPDMVDDLRPLVTVG
jgi:competence protein ComEA